VTESNFPHKRFQKLKCAKTADTQHLEKIVNSLKRSDGHETRYLVLKFIGSAWNEVLDGLFLFGQLPDRCINLALGKGVDWDALNNLP